MLLGKKVSPILQQQTFAEVVQVRRVGIVAVEKTDVSKGTTKIFSSHHFLNLSHDDLFVKLDTLDVIPRDFELFVRPFEPDDDHLLTGLVCGDYATRERKWSDLNFLSTGVLLNVDHIESVLVNRRQFGNVAVAFVALLGKRRSDIHVTEDQTKNKN